MHRGLEVGLRRHMPVISVAYAHDMIVENRRIIFSPEAVREAVKLYRESFPQKQPPGVLGPIILRNQAPLALGISVQAVGASNFREIEMAETEIAAMLILYCRRLKIPLPRASSKSMEAQNDSLVLSITKVLPVAPAA